MQSDNREKSRSTTWKIYYQVSCVCVFLTFNIFNIKHLQHRKSSSIPAYERVALKLTFESTFRFKKTKTTITFVKKCELKPALFVGMSKIKYYIRVEARDIAIIVLFSVSIKKYTGLYTYLCHLFILHIGLTCR